MGIKLKNGTEQKNRLPRLFVPTVRSRDAIASENYNGSNIANNMKSILSKDPVGWRDLFNNRILQFIYLCEVCLKYSFLMK